MKDVHCAVEFPGPDHEVGISSARRLKFGVGESRRTHGETKMADKLEQLCFRISTHEDLLRNEQLEKRKLHTIEVIIIIIIMCGAG